MVEKELIAKKNDLFRKTFIGGKVMLTEGVRALPDNEQSELLETVQKFVVFNEDNDPHNEHDFGKIQMNGVNFAYKIDYYDDSYQYFKEDGNRVMTIMRMDEY